MRDVDDSPRYSFVKGNICDPGTLEEAMAGHDAVVHFAAESHVDRSIVGSDDFVNTNCFGTNVVMDTARRLEIGRVVHIGTDEVYGSVETGSSKETDPLEPRSPYSASKAGSDHLVRAYHHTYGLPAITTNCSNNYGPYQFPEKLIPLVILNALAGKPLPVYGDGSNVRDWLYVDDHCSAIRLALKKGRPGETYNIGGNNERANIDVVRSICRILDELRPAANKKPYESLITFVADRPGHDLRYAIDATKSTTELGWKPEETFESGIRKTVRWYLDNPGWVQGVVSGEYRKWMEKNYSERQ